MMHHTERDRIRDVLLDELYGNGIPDAAMRVDRIIARITDCGGLLNADRRQLRPYKMRRTLTRLYG